MTPFVALSGFSWLDM